MFSLTCNVRTTTNRLLSYLSSSSTNNHSISSQMNGIPNDLNFILTRKCFGNHRQIEKHQRDWKRIGGIFWKWYRKPFGMSLFEWSRYQHDNSIVYKNFFWPIVKWMIIYFDSWCSQATSFELNFDSFRRSYTRLTIHFKILEVTYWLSLWMKLSRNKI